MRSGREGAARLVTAIVVLGACAWVGWQWLPLDWTEKELAAAASRVWDIRRELTTHGRVPWWTPYFMSGSAYALQHAQGLPLVIWLGLSTGLGLAAAGKMVALLAVAASALTMYLCARRLLGSPWAAALAAVAYALHPQQAFRALGDEHVGLSVAFALVPLAWLAWTHATTSGTFRSAFGCALVLTALLWTSSKHALVLGLFLALGTTARLFLAERRAARPALRGALLVLALGVGLGAFCIVPALEESRHARLFAGEDVVEWQRQLAFRSLLGLVDRDGVLTRPLLAAAEPVAVPDAAERAARERVALLKFESGGKYAGGVLLVLAAGAALLGRHRDPMLLGTLGAMFLACVAAATGLDSVWTANATTLRALGAVPGMPATGRAAAAMLPVLALGALVAFAARGRGRRRVAAGLALVVLTFVPIFRLLAALPFFGDIRAPFVFYDLPATFALALLAGCFVTDVVESGRWRAHAPVIVLGLVALVLVDHAPAARAMHAHASPPTFMADLEAAYGAARDDPDWTKTYYVSTRNQHLLGPLFDGRPQVYEAWTKWMSPLGTGLLNERSWWTADANRAYLDLVGARWVVFDKGDAVMLASNLARQMLDFYRRWFEVRLENASTVVFRNPTAWPYISVHPRAALFLGDVRASPDLALALAARRIPLVHLEDGSGGPLATFAFGVVGGVYVDAAGETQVRTIPSLRDQVIPLRGGSIRLPDPAPAVVAAAVTALERPGNGELSLRLDMPEPGLAVIAESYHPHWRATVDGRPAPVSRVSCGLMGLQLGAGAHEVRMRFEVPIAYGVAAMASLVTLLAGVVLARRSP